MAALNSSKTQRIDRFLSPLKFTKSVAEVNEKGSAFLRFWNSKNYDDGFKLYGPRSQNFDVFDGVKYEQMCSKPIQSTHKWFTDEIYRTRMIKISSLAAQGILIEGEFLGERSTARKIADRLMNIRMSLDHVCIELYTESIFIYNNLNEALRENDFSKIPTLAPYGFMLYQALINSNTMVYNTTVYRGALLKPEMINEYELSIGQLGKWLAFSSTSKDREVAECFGGNSLFIIDIKEPVPIDCGYDISKLSHFSDENEVLLLAGGRFQIDKVKFDIEDNKHLIYLTVF